MKLFVYGSLMNPEVLEAILGTSFPLKGARLKNFKRVKVKGASFPAIFPKKGSAVDGMLIEDLSEQYLTLLDDFEGDYYQRESVSVVTSDKSQQLCQVYIFKSKFSELLSDHDWNNQHFRDNDMFAFLSGIHE